VGSCSREIGERHFGQINGSASLSGGISMTLRHSGHTIRMDFSYRADETQAHPPSPRAFWHSAAAQIQFFSPRGRCRDDQSA
jgi:hypothetical protein